MRDPFNDGGDTVGRGDLEENVDTGGVNPARVGGSNPITTGGGGDITGVQRGDVLSEDELVERREDLQDIFADHGAQRESYDSIEDIHRARAEEQARMDQEDAEWEAYVAEQERLEAEKDAAR